MFKVFEEFNKNIKFKPKSYSIDNTVFKLHYRVTTITLMVATVLVTSRQYIGEHIRCISDAGVDEKVMNTFCFFTSTFTVVHHLNSSIEKYGFAHPGVGPYVSESAEPIIRHAYYQWVPFVLFGQAIMFYLPHLLWKVIEGQRMRKITQGLELSAYSLSDKSITVGGKAIPTKVDKEERLTKIREIFIGRLYINRTWSWGLMFCEFLNMFNVILQIYLTDCFLGGRFFELGPRVVSDGFDTTVDILDIVFPKVTKCTFYKYGPTGTIQSHDAMCVMALNILNEKIYTFLWFWYVILFCATVLSILWRLVTICLHARSQKFNEYIFATTCPGKLNPWRVLKVTRYCNFTDWIFLYYLSKNLDGFVFRDLFITLAEEIDDSQPLLNQDCEASSSHSSNTDKRD